MEPSVELSLEFSSEEVVEFELVESELGEVELGEFVVALEGSSFASFLSPRIILWEELGYCLSSRVIFSTAVASIGGFTGETSFNGSVKRTTRGSSEAATSW